MLKELLDAWVLAAALCLLSGMIGVFAMSLVKGGSQTEYGKGYEDGYIIGLSDGFEQGKSYHKITKAITTGLKDGIEHSSKPDSLISNAFKHYANKVTNDMHNIMEEDNE